VKLLSDLLLHAVATNELVNLMISYDTKTTVLEGREKDAGSCVRALSRGSMTFYGSGVWAIVWVLDVSSATVIDVVKKIRMAN